MDLSALMVIYNLFAQHMVLSSFLALSYLSWPGIVTSFFSWVEQKVSAFKLSILGMNIDLSQLPAWSSQLNTYIADFVISLGPQIVDIRNQVIGGKMDAAAGEAAVEALLQSIIQSFEKGVPTYIEQILATQFGADKVATAEFLMRRIVAILHDLNLGGVTAVDAVAKAKKKV